MRRASYPFRSFFSKSTLSTKGGKGVKDMDVTGITRTIPAVSITKSG
jgi:hypothetical protein